MSLLDKLSEQACWEDFYQYKLSLACPKNYTKYLRSFIDGQMWFPVCEVIRRGDRFPLPARSVISKQGSEKKRTVYTYPEPENTVLKLLTFLLLRKYDGLFCDNLYSFRPGRTAKDAVRHLFRATCIGQPSTEPLYSYKADISNYFNSIPVDRLLPVLSVAVADDPPLFSFLRALLTEPCVLSENVPIIEEKGIMAGTPLSSFYANVYLKELDRHFADLGVPYARYSDDIILFAPSEEEARAHADFLKSYLAQQQLSINPAKEHFGAPDEGWTFLGFICQGNTVDIAPATVTKLKKKMRRKARALLRWRERNAVSGEKAGRAFVRIFNRKLMEGGEDNELTWSRWFFPVINTDESLREIDLYAQDCIRYLVSGRRTKARYDVRYEDLKALGYRSLVHEYYAIRR